MRRRGKRVRGEEKRGEKRYIFLGALDDALCDECDALIAQHIRIKLNIVVLKGGR